MPKTIKATLGETEYTFPQLNLGQIEELAEVGSPIGADGAPLQGKAAMTNMLANAAIIFRGADPPIADLRALVCTVDEIGQVIVAIYRLSGLVKDVKPGEAQAEAEADGLKVLTLLRG